MALRIRDHIVHTPSWYQHMLLAELCLSFIVFGLAIASQGDPPLPVANCFALGCAIEHYIAASYYLISKKRFPLAYCCWAWAFLRFLQCGLWPTCFLLYAQTLEWTDENNALPNWMPTHLALSALTFALAFCSPMTLVMFLIFMRSHRKAGLPYLSKCRRHTSTGGTEYAINSVRAQSGSGIHRS